jgi:hypothetical protein
MPEICSLSAKLKKQLLPLKLSAEQEEIIVNELDCLSNIIIDAYLEEHKADDEQ